MLWGTIARILAGKAERALARRGTGAVAASRYAEEAEELYDRYGEPLAHTASYLEPGIREYADAHAEQLYAAPEFLHEPYHHIVERSKAHKDDLETYLDTAEPYDDAFQYGPENIAEPYDEALAAYGQDALEADAGVARYGTATKGKTARDRRKRIEEWEDEFLQDLEPDTSANP